MRKILVALSVVAVLSIGLLPQQSAASGKKKSSKPHTINITGDISGMPEQLVVIELLRANDSIVAADSQKSNASGHFELKVTLSEPGLYRVRFMEQRFLLLSLTKGNMKIAAVWPVNEYTLTGSAPSQHLKIFIDTVKTNMASLSRYATQVDSIKRSGNDAVFDECMKILTERNAAFVKQIKQYSDTTPYEANAILASRIVNAKGELPYFEAFTKSLERRFPGTEMTKDYAQFFEQVKESIPASTELGDAAPDFKLNDVNGTPVTLSSYRGKYVLIDFWASWCGPCRAENPNVVAAYNKHKAKNFTILGVSLDNKKDLWLKAIEKDKLPWQHVSDLKGWQSLAASKYAVQSIPTNFLIDPNGKIIAKNLRGAELDAKLAELLK